MKVYLGQTRGLEWMAKLDALGFGEMTVRGEMNPRRRPWAFDNGAFRDWKAGTPFDGNAYQADLDAVWRFNGEPDFMVVPDIVAGGIESLRFSETWACSMTRFRAPLYLAVQDGMPEEDVRLALLDYGGLFVGGTLEWKVSTGLSWVQLAHEVGKPCHIGRVGTERRAGWANDIGADSIDSCLPLFSEENLRRFLEDSAPEPRESSHSVRTTRNRHATGT